MLPLAVNRCSEEVSSWIHAGGVDVVVLRVLAHVELRMKVVKDLNTDVNSELVLCGGEYSTHELVDKARVKCH